MPEKKEKEDLGTITQPDEEPKSGLPTGDDSKTASELPTGDDEEVILKNSRYGDENAPDPESDAEQAEEAAAEGVDEPPTPIGDAPADDKDDNPDPSFLGKIEESEQQTIVTLQQKHQQMVYQLGNSVLQMFNTVDQIGGISEQIQGVYTGIGKRLNVGPKTRWTVMQDGSVRIVPEQPGPQAVPPQGDKPEK